MTDQMCFRADNYFIEFLIIILIRLLLTQKGIGYGPTSPSLLVKTCSLHLYQKRYYTETMTLETKKFYQFVGSNFNVGVVH